MLVFRPFQWEICHNTLQQSWITIKNQHFHTKKSDLGPVHLDQISDKLDYLSCPSGQNFFFHFFSFGQATSSLGKWNWHLLNFFSFTFIIAQCVLILLGFIIVKLQCVPFLTSKKTFNEHAGIVNIIPFVFFLSFENTSRIVNKGIKIVRVKQELFCTLYSLQMVKICVIQFQKL